MRNKAFRKPRYRHTPDRGLVARQLLDEVERGETSIITRHGRAIARIVPERARRQEEIDRAHAAILELRKHAKKVTVTEILPPATRAVSADGVRIGCSRRSVLGTS
ncbi:MAG: type II toxin-antitoxin system Phd/YefM family antitoxin [Bryobacterales bacterium]|nr:type II toxin-antitoxin system Phd/YefM family antitoxin [Bryobacterales bacterium]MBV9397620.1 type II toxin-antitoxin system Phd/YefM family antitoxin [Bryobacterales bacterium]